MERAAAEGTSGMLKMCERCLEMDGSDGRGMGKWVWVVEGKKSRKEGGGK